MILTVVMAAALVQPECDWNRPGAKPTISSVSATLHAMGIDSPALTAKIQAGDYSETVTIRRLDDRTWGMSSGNAHWCAGEVDRHEWPDDRAEQGRVYRVPGGPAVVWYWRCKNMSLWLPAEATTTSLTPPPETFELPSEPTGAGTVPHAQGEPARPFDSLDIDGDGAPQIVPPIVGFVGGSGVGCDCVLSPVAAIPEPDNALLLLPGLLALCLRMGRHGGKGRRSP